MPESSIDQMLSVSKVAELFAVTPETIRNWCKEGKFPNATKPGGTIWKIPESDVRALAQATYGSK